MKKIVLKQANNYVVIGHVDAENKLIKVEKLTIQNDYPVLEQLSQ